MDAAVPNHFNLLFCVFHITPRYRGYAAPGKTYIA
jgi:hypothetical protein